MISDSSPKITFAFLDVFGDPHSVLRIPDFLEDVPFGRVFRILRGGAFGNVDRYGVYLRDTTIFVSLRHFGRLY